MLGALPDLVESILFVGFSVAMAILAGTILENLFDMDDKKKHEKSN